MMSPAALSKRPSSSLLLRYGYFSSKREPAAHKEYAQSKRKANNDHCITHHVYHFSLFFFFSILDPPFAAHFWSPSTAIGGGHCRLVWPEGLYSNRDSCCKSTQMIIRFLAYFHVQEQECKDRGRILLGFLAYLFFRNKGATDRHLTYDFSFCFLTLGVAIL